jgi:HD-GYP domain-containing protein (c-di-GMP phosphodiesterase class II)
VKVGESVLDEIVGIVDVYDALTSARPCRAARSRADARRHLRKEAVDAEPPRWRPVHC